jgi:hypothetical protein
MAGGEEELWLVARRDHDGNYDVVMRPPGQDYAWNLTECEADAIIAQVLENQLKVHGQSYWKFTYPVAS